MTYKFLGAFLLCTLLTSLAAFGQRAHTPAPGTEERQALMDALRVPVEKDLKQSVIFKVDRLRVAGDWAYARVQPISPNGRDIDFNKTKYRKHIEFGTFDPQGEALLRLEENGWRVMEWAFGASDVPSAGWSEKYRFPRSLLE